MAAAAPSATPAQSNTDSPPATFGMAQSLSTEYSLRNCARGLRAPLWWFFDATRASAVFMSPLGTPYLFAYAGATIENIAAAVTVRAVPSPGTGNALRP